MSRTTCTTLLICAIFIGFFIWAMLPRDDFSKKVSDTLQNEQKKADVIFKDATLAEVYDGVKYWELVAVRAVVNKSTGRADMVDVNGLSFDNGKPTIKFLAPSALWNINKNEIYMKDPIGYDASFEEQLKERILKGKKSSDRISYFHLAQKGKGEAFGGFWFQAKNLNWKLTTKKLLCHGAISLTKGNVVISSEDLESDVGMQKVRLTGHPSAEVAADPSPIIMNADEMLVDSSANTVTARNKVHITRNGSDIVADASTYSQSSNKVTMTGNVRINDGEIHAWSRSASYDIAGKLVTLTEDARAERNGNKIYGDRMTLYLGLNKIVVEGRSKATVKEVEVK